MTNEIIFRKSTQYSVCSLSINVDVQFFFLIIVSRLLQNVHQITALMVEHATRIKESHRLAGNYIPLK